MSQNYTDSMSQAIIVRKSKMYSDYKRKRPRSAAKSTNSNLVRSKGAQLGLYKNSISRCTRSAFRDFPIVAQGQYDFGFAVGAQSYYYSLNTLASTATNWTGSTDFTDLYDSYRVMGFQITATFNQNVSSVTTGTVQTLPYMYVIKDYTDINTVSGSSAEFVQKSDCVQICLGRNAGKGYDYKGYVVPKIAAAVYSTSSAVGYQQPKAQQWISVSNPTGNFIDVPHCGFKFYVDCSQMTAPITTNIGSIRFYIKAFYEMKQNT